MEPQRRDFLKEVINIGVGRAGKSLSELINTKVFLTVPDLEICSFNDLQKHLAFFGNDKILSVTQSFTGMLSGDAVLIFSNYSGLLLTQKLTESLDITSIEAEKEAVLTEVGNIIINSLVGSWSEIFYDHFKFSLPEYFEGTIPSILENRLIAPDEDDGESVIICANAHFEVKEFFIVGTILTLFDKAFIEKLLGSVAK
jgi:chemotaxis protein CheC